MKNHFHKALGAALLLMSLIAVASCNIQDQGQTYDFTFAPGAVSAVSASRGGAGPNFAVFDGLSTAKKLYVEMAEGTASGSTFSVVGNLKTAMLDLFTFGGATYSEGWTYTTTSGSYVPLLTKFMVLDASGAVIYATPTSSSPLGYLVSSALPMIPYSVQDGSGNVAPKVVSVAGYTPASFGYSLGGWDCQPLSTTSVVVSVNNINASGTAVAPSSAYSLSINGQAFAGLTGNANRFLVLTNSSTYAITATYNSYAIFQSYTPAQIAAGTIPTFNFDFVAPVLPAVTSLTISRSSSSLTPSWSAATDNFSAVSYIVEYRLASLTDASYVKIGNVSNPTATISGLTSASTYLVRVSAVDAQGNKSGYYTVTGFTTL